MGLFDFLKTKPKKNKLNDFIQEMTKKIFPNGEKDIEAGTNKLLLILNNSISKSEARNIFVKSVSISHLSEKFDKERLKQHLTGYCVQHFNEKQIEAFHGYLSTLLVALSIHGCGPSELRQEGNIIVW